MSRCRRCGEEVPPQGIHLSRDWPGRKEAVESALPGHPVSMCKNPPPPEFWKDMTFEQYKEL